MTSFCCFGTYRDIFRVWLIQLGFNGCVWGMVWVISLTRPWPIPSGISEPSHFDLDPGRAEGETCWRKLSSGRGRSSYFPQLFFQGKSTGKKLVAKEKSRPATLVSCRCSLWPIHWWSQDVSKLDLRMLVPVYRSSLSPLGKQAKPLRKPALSSGHRDADLEMGPQFWDRCLYQKACVSILQRLTIMNHY